MISVEVESNDAGEWRWVVSDGAKLLDRGPWGPAEAAHAGQREEQSFWALEPMEPEPWPDDYDPHGWELEGTEDERGEGVRYG